MSCKLLQQQSQQIQSCQFKVYQEHYSTYSIYSTINIIVQPPCRKNVRLGEAVTVPSMACLSTHRNTVKETQTAIAHTDGEEGKSSNAG